MKIAELEESLNLMCFKRYSALDNRIFGDSGVVSSNDNDFETVICGIDIGLKEVYAIKKCSYDIRKCLFLSHHPIGHFAEEIPNAMRFYRKTVFKGCDNTGFLDQEIEYQKKLYLNDNITRESQLLELISLNCICIHTLADMLAYDYLNNCFSKCCSLEEIVNIIISLPEMKDAKVKVAIAYNNDVVGSIVPVVSGGCMFSSKLFDKVQCDTMVVPGYNAELEQLSKKYKKNIIFCNHMALDSLGMNLLLAELNLKCDLSVSGYTYVDRSDR